MPHSSPAVSSNVELLGRMLITLIDLRIKVKQAHWNVTGPSFIGVHKLFDSYAEELDAAVDVVAERQRFLGAPTKVSLDRVASQSELDPFRPDLTKADAMIEYIVSISGAVSEDLKQGVFASDEAEDPASSDILTDVLRTVDQYIYLLRSHLE